MNEPLTVAVEIDGRTVEAGTAYFTERRGVLSTSFQYHQGYLRTAGAYALDPALPLIRGQHYVSGLPGAFADAAPDRWGRNLIRKRIQTQALREGQTMRSINDVDYLTGVSDFTRQGALRFRPVDGGAFLHPDDDVPRMLHLPALLRAADRYAEDANDLSAVKALLAAGTAALGGSRPKTSVIKEGVLHIAKLPHRSDEWDVMAWEKAALDLAERAGIETPARRLEIVDGRGVLILGRFDRRDGQRVGYLSGMTLLQGADGGAYDYVDLAEAATEYAGADLRALWRRVAFSVAIHNTDDHLRNLGFLRAGTGWRLAPVFDINPNPDVAEERTTSIGGATALRDELDGLMLNADAFGLSRDEANQILTEVFAATRDWDRVAAANGISQSERRRFHDTFETLRPDATKIGSDQ